ncbi:MAG: branched-chain amino acid aminotransferase [Paracoccaceae bacterium]
MAIGSNIRTYFNGTWHQGDVPIMRAADHGSWQGTTVFDGARLFDGVAPDLEAHLARVNRSARALMMEPSVMTDAMLEIAREGLRLFDKGACIYIRPMYWAVDGDASGIIPVADSTGFALCMEEIGMSPPDAAITLSTTRFRRPVLENAVTNAKAGCLYPNNARMLAEARSKGYMNALALDAAGNVAETATANVFMVRDGEIFTPIANGTFLAGITRARHIANLAGEGMTVHETVLSYDDFRQADEVFLSGNFNKVTPVKEFEGTHYQLGPVTRRVRELYWDWAHSQPERV